MELTILALPQTRKLQGLVETTLGWDFQNDAVGGIYGEDDEVHEMGTQLKSTVVFRYQLEMDRTYLTWFLQFAPVIEMLDSTSTGEMAA